MRTLSLFEEDRLTLPKSIALSAESLSKYGEFYKHWAIAFSGGKDSTATVTLVAHLLETGRIPKPEHLDARRWMRSQVLGIQAEVNDVARSLGKPEISLINDEELARIEELIAANTYPERWDSTEHRGDEWLPEILPDGSVQNLLFNDSEFDPVG